MSDNNDNTTDNADSTTQPNPVKRITRTVLIVCLVLFIWYVWADRVTPLTDQARVRGYVVSISPLVSGNIVEVNVGLNQLVESGQVLAQIDPTNYDIALNKARAELEKVSQDLGADTASVVAAQGKLDTARSTLKSVEADVRRILAVEHKGIIPKADVDRAKARLQQARSQVVTAEANLQVEKEQLGKKGEENPRMRSALAAVQAAKRDLDHTTLVAPSDGGVTNVRVEVGTYAKSGQPLMTFVSTKDVWIEANMRENNIANIKPGNEVDIVLDVAPGRVFKGEVASVGFAVSWDGASSSGRLPVIKSPSGWLRDAQRFPVYIKFADDEAYGLRREGGQADVVVYTGNNFLLNAIAWCQIRIISLLSYVY